MLSFRGRVSLAAAATTHPQVLLAVDAPQLLVVGRYTFPRQKITQAAIAEPAAFRRQVAPQRSIISPCRLISAVRAGLRRPDCTPDDRSGRDMHEHGRQLPASRRASPFFFTPDPSAPRCPASPRPAASSTERFPPRAPANAEPRIPPARPTSTSVCRMSRSSRRDVGTRPPSPCLPLLLQDRDELLFAEPAPLHIRPTPLRRTLPSRGHISGEHVKPLEGGSQSFSPRGNLVAAKA